ncbi:MAG: hypothetical protein NBV67_01785 [Tagaea sp.]|nr:hypothetical protein [Tagaea sp.]
MPRITKVEIHEFAYRADGIVYDAGGFDLVQTPGGGVEFGKFVTVIEAQGGCAASMSACGAPRGCRWRRL